MALRLREQCLGRGVTFRADDGEVGRTAGEFGVRDEDASLGAALQRDFPGNQETHRWLLASTFTLVVFGLIYLGAVEYFFFDEFNSRFNFVAAEYLIYPHEVFVNIWQSYPVARVLLATIVLTAVAIWFMRKPLLGKRTAAGSRRIGFATNMN
jgi:hypothetical protein